MRDWDRRNTSGEELWRIISDFNEIGEVLEVCNIDPVEFLGRKALKPEIIYWTNAYFPKDREDDEIMHIYVKFREERFEIKYQKGRMWL